MVTTAPKPPTQPTATADTAGTPPLVLRLSPLIELTEEQFAQFCGLNPELHIERTATGELEIMSPTKGPTGNRNAKITTQLEIWTERDGTGLSFDSSMGYTLPNDAVREPDASWVSKSRLAALSPQDRARFIPLCPDFVFELRSDSDRLADLQAKMQEYIANGARLGWLIDPQTTRVYTYRPNHEVQILQDPETVSADPILPGFTLDLTQIWNPWHWLPADTQKLNTDN